MQEGRLRRRLRIKLVVATLCFVVGSPWVVRVRSTARIVVRRLNLVNMNMYVGLELGSRLVELGS
jgi:hypothetical protein